MAFCNSRDYAIGIIVEFRINRLTVPERFWQDPDAIWIQSAKIQEWLKIIPVLQDIVQKSLNIVTILIRYCRIWHDMVTISIRVDNIGWVSPNGTGRTLLSSVLLKSLDYYRSIGISYKRIRFRSDNNRSFKIIEDSSPTCFCVSYRCISDLKREP